MNKKSRLDSLKKTHAELDIKIKDLGPYAHLRVSFLKKTKLKLKEQIVQLENELNEDMYSK
jgi:hypothetical protein